MNEKPVATRHHPRPQLQRGGWGSLNGAWDFAVDPEAQWSQPDEVEWNAQIVVPFSPETLASGISDTGFYESCWYRRTFAAPHLSAGQRLLLHFGAVDHKATVWINGRLAGHHEGGYTPFACEATNLLVEADMQSVVVRAEDDPHDLAKPRGKQGWQLNPHSIWYTRTTGIWQTVWLERVPTTWISDLRWTSSLERWEIGVEIRLCGDYADGMRVRVRLEAGDLLLADDDYAIVGMEVQRRIALTDPGIDDYRNELLWSPATPTLINAQLQLMSPEGTLIDKIHSYTALRSIDVQGDRFVLNGRPYPLRMVLDQGYWLETGATAPNDDALRRDVELAKAMGFNGVRKHQKIEDPRYLYWADVLGLLVWEEMPSAYRFTRKSVDKLAREWIEVIERDSSHPCIVAWVPFNESWGVPDLPVSPTQRHYVQALYHLTKTLDPTRPVVGNDGWESVATDIIGIHDYDYDPAAIGRRYGTHEALPQLFQRERPGGRLLLLDERGHGGRPIMLTEFGGIALSAEKKKTWGYSRAASPEDFGVRYTELLEVVRTLPLMSGFCYTQFADTFQEANGLLYADRTPKFPIEEIARATRGPHGAHDLQQEYEWRERLMNVQALQYLVPPEDYHLHEPRS
jgi:beta-galactosidase/beta-glucuronidase